MKWIIRGLMAATFGLGYLCLQRQTSGDAGALFVFYNIGLLLLWAQTYSRNKAGLTRISLIIAVLPFAVPGNAHAITVPVTPVRKTFDDIHAPIAFDTALDGRPLSFDIDFGGDFLRFYTNPRVTSQLLELQIAVHVSGGTGSLLPCPTLAYTIGGRGQMNSDGLWLKSTQLVTDITPESVVNLPFGVVFPLVTPPFGPARTDLPAGYVDIYGFHSEAAFTLPADFTITGATFDLFALSSPRANKGWYGIIDPRNVPDTGSAAALLGLGLLSQLLLMRCNNCQDGRENSGQKVLLSIIPKPWDQAGWPWIRWKGCPVCKRNWSK